MEINPQVKKTKDDPRALVSEDSKLFVELELIYIRLDKCNSKFN